ncbi:MAG TPA: FprA family A-type flavoprotein [Firmicutes bacterium]|nr:FprA family A-type flavoprotein [Bacillota bacterium]
MRIEKVTDRVNWIGVLDPELEIFDIVIPTKWGTTYNAYIINAEKITLVETAKEVFHDEYIDKLKASIDPKKIEYLVVNHTEPDHAGSISRVLDLNPEITIVSSRSANMLLKEQLNRPFKSIIANDGDTLSLGDMTLEFISAPMLHWPDSMFTYLKEEQVLFTCDAFGCHFCHPEGKLFDDESGDFSEAFRYYYDEIMAPFKPFIIDAVDKVMDLPIKIVATGHGPIIRTDPKKYFALYKEWSLPVENDKKTLAVAYVSAYGYTKKMAEAIADGFKQAGGDVELLDVSNMDFREMRAIFEKADALAFGSPTINSDAVLPIWLAIGAVSPKTSRNKPALAFGNYGWSGEGVFLMEERMKGLKLKLVADGFRVRFTPTEEDLQKAKELGKKLYSEC